MERKMFKNMTNLHKACIFCSQRKKQNSSPGECVNSFNKQLWSVDIAADDNVSESKLY